MLRVNKKICYNRPYSPRLGFWFWKPVTRVEVVTWGLNPSENGAAPSVNRLCQSDIKLRCLLACVILATQVQGNQAGEIVSVVPGLVSVFKTDNPTATRQFLHCHTICRWMGSAISNLQQPKNICMWCFGQMCHPSVFRNRLELRRGWYLHQPWRNRLHPSPSCRCQIGKLRDTIYIISHAAGEWGGASSNIQQPRNICLASRYITLICVSLFNNWLELWECWYPRQPGWRWACPISKPNCVQDEEKWQYQS